MHPKRVFIVNWWPVIEFPSFPSSNFPSLLNQRVASRGGGVHSWQPLVPRCLFRPYLWSNSSGTRVYLSARADGVSPVQFRDDTRAARTNWLSKQKAVCVPLSIFFIFYFFPVLVRSTDPLHTIFQFAQSLCFLLKRWVLNPDLGQEAIAGSNLPSNLPLYWSISWQFPLRITS